MIMLDPIGTVETPFDTFSEAPSQGFLADYTGKITLRSPLDHAVKGLETGDLVDIVWYADGADRSLLRLNNDEQGVFATRSQDRPNPISITRCEIVSIEENEILIKGVDMIDETPILDIKAAFDGPGQERTQSGDAPATQMAPSVDLD